MNSFISSPEQFARARIAQSQDEIRNSLKMVAMGIPYAAEPDAARRRARVQAKGNLSSAEAMAFDANVRRHCEDALCTHERGAAEADPFAAAEAVWGDTIDFVDVAFLARGARIARSVGRVTNGSTGRGWGSGVLIGGGLFLTNNHVLTSAAHANGFILEFDYERDERGVRRPETRFALDTSLFAFAPVEGLDFAIVGVGDRISGPAELDELGVSPLSDASDKHMLGEFANIIQHPQGRLKEVVLRENRLIGRFDDFLHYVADTEKGSSGSPVFNSEWQVIALHHWGEPFGAPGDALVPASSEVNEGTRISSIVRHLRRNRDTFDPALQVRIEEALGGTPGGAESRAPVMTETGRREHAQRVEVDAEGRAVWVVPLEVSVRLPMAAAPAARPAPPTGTISAEQRPSRATDPYVNRKGYQPHFLTGFQVPLPSLGPEIIEDAAPLIDPDPGANPYELKYHHFSVIMNRRRRLAIIAACMIDGASSGGIHRRTRGISDPGPDRPGLADVVGRLDEAEADNWTVDPRIERDHQSGDELYRRQEVPGSLALGSVDRIPRVFQKGHLVRRLDPAWGADASALEAEMDTFHWTNAAPHVGFFNTGAGDEDAPETGKGNLWRTAEDDVLRNAAPEDQRVISFTGPIFHEDDRGFRHTKVPGRFFKITIWVQAGVLRSLALIVDQMQVIEAWPRELGNGQAMTTIDRSEAFQDPDEMSRVTDFLSTVEDLENLTDLDFGDAVRSADMRRGQRTTPMDSAERLQLGRVGPGNDPAGVPGPGDDLKAIRGIGPKIETALHRNGIQSFAQIAGWGASEAREMAASMGNSGLAERYDWVSQARALMKRADA